MRKLWKIQWVFFYLEKGSSGWKSLRNICLKDQLWTNGIWVIYLTMTPVPFVLFEAVWTWGTDAANATTTTFSPNHVLTLSLTTLATLATFSLHFGLLCVLHLSTFLIATFLCASGLHLLRLLGCFTLKFEFSFLFTCSHYFILFCIF